MPNQIQRYASTLPDKLDALRSALTAASQDPQNSKKFEQTLSLAHKLRGSAGTFGFMHISDAAAEIEDKLLACEHSGSMPAWQVLIDNLQNHIDRHLQQQTVDLGGVQPYQASIDMLHSPWGCILVLDDDEDFLQLIGRMLEAHGYQAILTAQPNQVQRLMEKVGPDLLLLDIEMPEQNGIDVCALLRADAHWKNIPIIFLTAHSDVDNRIAAFEAKANDFITKPVIEAELIARIGVRVERARLLREREAMFARLERSHANLLSVLNQLYIGAALTDEQGRILFISDACKHFFGLSTEDALGKRWHELPTLTKATAQQLSERQGTVQVHAQRTRIRVQTGANRSFWLEVDVRTNPDQEQGNIFYFYDVTEVQNLREQLIGKRNGRIVGNSKPILDLLLMAAEIARGTWTVMIEGETGTGKELVARTIHDLSPRKDKPFIAVNCAALTESLITSQLFGHRRGAFTGALADQQGVFEAADGGTLFLDEIGDVPMNVQSALLRVLEERVVTRVGETRSRKVDVRVLVATHKNLSQEVDEGRFREDLFYRIKVARIKVPPLRERREDIPLLAVYCIDDCRLQAGKKIDEISKEAMQRLMAYDWPGNVRELKNAIQYAVIACNESIIQIDDLPPELFTPHAGEAKLEFEIEGKDEKSKILAALKAAKGNRTRAAQLLGIGRATLYRHISELNIDLKS